MYILEYNEEHSIYHHNNVNICHKEFDYPLFSSGFYPVSIIKEIDRTDEYNQLLIHLAAEKAPYRKVMREVLLYVMTYYDQYDTDWSYTLV